jgi:hypothetical protein
MACKLPLLELNNLPCEPWSHRDHDIHIEIEQICTARVLCAQDNLRWVQHQLKAKSMIVLIEQQIRF